MKTQTNNRRELHTPYMQFLLLMIRRVDEIYDLLSFFEWSMPEHCQDGVLESRTREKILGLKEMLWENFKHSQWSDDMTTANWRKAISQLAAEHGVIFSPSEIDTITAALAEAGIAV